VGSTAREKASVSPVVRPTSRIRQAITELVGERLLRSRPGARASRCRTSSLRLHRGVVGPHVHELASRGSAADAARAGITRWRSVEGGS